jgi:hypothetical protein
MQNNYFQHIVSLFYQIHLGLILAEKAFLIGLSLTIYRRLKTRHPTNKFAFLKEFLPANVFRAGEVRADYGHPKAIYQLWRTP